MADKSLKLSIVVAAQDLASGKLSNVNRELAGMGKAGKIATAGFAGIGRAGSKLGGMFGSLKSRVTGLVGAMGPLLGIGAGLGIAAFFTDAIDKARSFGDQTLKLKAIIGGTTETVSGLVDTLGDWGVSAEAQNKILGFGEKAIFKYTKTTKDATKFQQTYGLGLVDNKGHVVDMNEALRRSAGLLASNAPATKKNAAMTALWGKSWKDLIPLIGHGTKFFDDQIKGSDKLTKKELDNIRALATSQQVFNDKLDRLKVAIGLAIIPTLIDVTRKLGTFVSKNQAAIIGAVKGGIALAQQIGAAFGQVVGGLQAAWAAVPKPMQDLLIKGFVADRTFKFLFGFSPAKLIVGVATDVIGKGIGNLVGGIFSRGGSPATPMFTKEVGLPGGPGGPGLPPGAAPPGGITVPAIGAGILIDRKPLTDMAHDFAQYARDQVAQGKNANFTFKSIARESALSRGDSARALGTITGLMSSTLGKLPGIGPMIVGAVNSLKPHIDAIRINASVAYLTGPTGRTRPVNVHPHAGNRPAVGYVDKGGGARKGGRAAGGPVWPGGTYTVGEHGPERLTMGYGGGYVTPMGGRGVVVNVRTEAHVSARESHRADRRWRRVSTSNGSGVTIG